MRIKLEQEFYNTFEIEPKYYCTYEKVAENKLEYECTNNNLEKCKECQEVGKRYPVITAEKLFEMICILNKEAVYGYSDWGGNFIIGETIEELKESILTDCIRNKSKVFKQIQQLFEEDKQ